MWCCIEPALHSNTFLAEVIDATPGGETLLICLQCGTCSGSCPSGPDMEYSPRKIFALIRAGERDEVLKSNTPWYCVSCYSCMVRCPKDIPITDIMYTLKNKAVAENAFTDREAPDWSKIFVSYVENFGRSFELGLAAQHHLTHKPCRRYPCGWSGWNGIYPLHPSEYQDHIEERVEPWTYLKFPYHKKVGWYGFNDGIDSGIYKSTPLARLNAADGMATPLAQAECERMYDTLGGKPAQHTLATHWARLVELLYAAEHWVELSQDPDIIGENYRVPPESVPTEGIGCVEPPRGTLTHHYKTDERGILTHVNLIVGTTNNNAAINLSVKKLLKV